MQRKFSAAEAAYMLKSASAALVTLSNENAALRAKLASKEQHERSTKLAEQMHSKGIDAHVPIDRLADQLDQMAEQGKFAELERAVDMVGPDMGVGMALRGGDEVETGSSDQLTSWLTGQIG